MVPLPIPLADFSPYLTWLNGSFCDCGSPETMTAHVRCTPGKTIANLSFLVLPGELDKAGVFNYSCWLPCKPNLIQALNPPTWKPSVVDTLCEGNMIFSGLCDLRGPQASGLGDSALWEFQTEIVLG